MISFGFIEIRPGATKNIYTYIIDCGDFYEEKLLPNFVFYNNLVVFFIYMLERVLFFFH